MGEAVLVIAGLAILSLFANMLSREKSGAENDIGQPIEHTITVWGERERPPSQQPAARSPEPAPQRITVEYSVTIDADSEEMLAVLQHESVAAANEDFRRRFARFLHGHEIGSGVVRIEAVGGQ